MSSKSNKRQVSEASLITPVPLGKNPGAYFSDKTNVVLEADLDAQTIKISMKGQGSVHVPFSNVRYFRTKMNGPKAG